LVLLYVRHNILLNVDDASAKRCSVGGEVVRLAITMRC
jgi:hypothetical protein